MHYLIELKIGGDLDNKKHVQRKKLCLSNIVFSLIHLVRKRILKSVLLQLIIDMVKANLGNKGEFYSFLQKKNS